MKPTLPLIVCVIYDIELLQLNMKKSNIDKSALCETIPYNIIKYPV